MVTFLVSPRNQEDDSLNRLEQVQENSIQDGEDDLDNNKESSQKENN
jgi:hypothetical protein